MCFVSQGEHSNVLSCRSLPTCSRRRDIYNIYILQYIYRARRPLRYSCRHNKHVCVTKRSKWCQRHNLLFARAGLLNQLPAGSRLVANCLRRFFTSAPCGRGHIRARTDPKGIWSGWFVLLCIRKIAHHTATEGFPSWFSRQRRWCNRRAT